MSAPHNITSPPSAQSGAGIPSGQSGQGAERRAYHRLHDGLSDMIESGRLREEHIPDDYAWLVETLASLAGERCNEGR